MTSKDPFDRLVQLDAESDANGLRIGCERLLDPAAADLILTCYGAIDASFAALAATADYGGAKLLEAGCSKCDRSGGADLAQEISDVFMIPVIELPSPDPGIKAKSPAPISGLFRQTVSTKMEHPAHNRAPGDGESAPGSRALDRPVRLDRDDLLRQRVPEKRQRLIESMAQSGPGESAGLPMTGLLWTVTIDPCDATKGALSLAPQGYFGALQFSAHELQAIISLPLGRCGNCGRPFVISGDIQNGGDENWRCEACELRGKVDEVLGDLM